MSVGHVPDLPDRINPMIVKELHQSMRRASFTYPFLLIQLLAVAALAMEFAGGETKRASYVGLMNVAMLIECGPFWNVVGVMCGVVMPLAGLMLMGQEVEDGNHELLLLTKLNRWAVVRGKFLVLWSISALSFISLLPYVVVRYFMGGVELLQELACSGTVLGVAALICSGAIGASSFQRVISKLLMLVFYLGSCVFSGLIALTASVLASDHWSPRITVLVYHIGVVIFLSTYLILGLSLARARLRLVLNFYEPHPRSGMIGLLIVTPIVTGMAALFTVGYAGFLGLLGMAFAAYSADHTPRGKPKVMVEY